MSQDGKQAAAVFIENGWKELPLSEPMVKAGLEGLFVCSYAAVGLVITTTIEEVVRRWADCQVQMSDVRQIQAVGPDKDLYLTLIFDQFDDKALDDLQSIMNDTHVCRKIGIERGGRTIKEALLDTPFFKLKDNNQPSDSPPDLENHGLSQELLKDLASRSAPTVLQKLLVGEYKKGRAK